MHTQGPGCAQAARAQCRVVECTRPYRGPLPDRMMVMSQACIGRVVAYGCRVVGRLLRACKAVLCRVQGHAVSQPLWPYRRHLPAVSPRARASQRVVSLCLGLSCHNPLVETQRTVLRYNSYRVRFAHAVRSVVRA